MGDKIAGNLGKITGLALGMFFGAMYVFVGLINTLTMIFFTLSGLVIGYILDDKKNVKNVGRILLDKLTNNNNTW